MRALLAHDTAVIRAIHEHRCPLRSPHIQHVEEQISMVASRNTTVLIQGETGAGKELVAYKIHLESSRANEPFVTIDASILTQELARSEIFGHRRGSFTGATENRPGLFQVANGGTLFIDEIAELSLELQAMLLRSIEDRTFRPIGSTHLVPVNIRIIAATNKDIEKEVELGRFRRDLFYRIKVFPISIPPLRDHPEDIPILVEYFLQEYSPDMPKHISPDAMTRLKKYRWPGNIRELKNVIERAVIMSGDMSLIQRVPLPHELEMPLSDPNADFLSIRNESGHYIAMDTLMRNYIELILPRFDGNQTKAAEALGIRQSTLNYQMERFGLRPKDIK